MKDRIIAIVALVHMAAFSVLLMLGFAGVEFKGSLFATIYAGFVGIGIWFHFYILKRRQAKADELQKEFDEFDAKKAAEKKEKQTSKTEKKD